MPSEEEWIRVHAELMAKLMMPCKLRFIYNEKYVANEKTPQLRKILGQHVWQDMGDYDDTNIRMCHISIDPDIDWRVPEHLILHEAAHHEADLFDEYHGHNERWAKILMGMYEATGVALPESTRFDTFAELAGIAHKEFQSGTEKA